LELQIKRYDFSKIYIFSVIAKHEGRTGLDLQCLGPDLRRGAALGDEGAREQVVGGGRAMVRKMVAGVFCVRLELRRKTGRG
jgi:hypothetical protein